ncbi:peptidoglycan/xylan/chitin deacetylase (PgdA/CDA1 family) [Sphingomonas sp. BK235]|nr:peptidoglycan/xylan/chitin deacetylase (PgdA/CDA1 family) [Sphingomonas sp. BK235]
MTMARPTRYGRRGVTAAAALLLAPGSPARAEPIAVTFDDLPVAGPSGPIGNSRTLTQHLLAGLRRQHIPAIGFVNEVQLEGPERAQRIALLADWLDAGMTLGNHGYSHLSFTVTPTEAYIADAARGERVTRPLMAARGLIEHFYRHPYLETGTTVDARSRFEAWLAAHGYRVAPVTMENSDWRFAARYDEALARHDPAEAKRIAAAYLSFTGRAVAWYRAAALDLLGRRPALILLLHANRLNAASIDALARVLRHHQLRFVTLDAALTDPAYAIADTYTGPNGDQWLTRWALTLRRPLPWSTLPAVPDWIAAPRRSAPQRDQTAHRSG